MLRLPCCFLYAMGLPGAKERGEVMWPSPPLSFAALFPPCRDFSRDLSEQVAALFALGSFRLSRVRFVG